MVSFDAKGSRQRVDDNVGGGTGAEFDSGDGRLGERRCSARTHLALRKAAEVSEESDIVSEVLINQGTLQSSHPR